MKTSRMADGRMVGNAVCRSWVVMMGDDVAAEPVSIQRWIAIEPASRTREERSAPTYPWVLSATASKSDFAIALGIFDINMPKISRRAMASGIPVKGH